LERKPLPIELMLEESSREENERPGERIKANTFPEKRSRRVPIQKARRPPETVDMENPK